MDTPVWRKNKEDRAGDGRCLGTAVVQSHEVEDTAQGVLLDRTEVWKLSSAAFRLKRRWRVGEAREGVTAEEEATKSTVSLKTSTKGSPRRMSRRAGRWG